MATFMKNINRVSQCSELYREKKLSSPGIAGYQTKYILGIAEERGISQENLARKIFVNKSNVARQLSRLEDAGYVRREENPDDKRSFNVYLTERGLAASDEIHGINAEWREKITEDFTEDEKKRLFELTERLCEKATKIMNGLTEQ